MRTDRPLVSVVIATYNMNNVIIDTLLSCWEQDYPHKEIIVYDDMSTDGTEDASWTKNVKYLRGDENVGVGNAFNAAIKEATGDIIVLMCADDLFTDTRVISDIVKCFQRDPSIGHVSRWYHQFLTEDYQMRPVRAWRSADPIIQANNPSGLAFTKLALEGQECSNKMFIETSALVSGVLRSGWRHAMLPWDTIAVRVHGSTSTKPGYWLKRRVSSPVEDWLEIGGHEIAKDFVSFIQIKNGMNNAAVWEEVRNFVKYRPVNLLHPGFWFFAAMALVTPRCILRHIPGIYRKHIGRWVTKEVKRP